MVPTNKPSMWEMSNERSLPFPEIIKLSPGAHIRESN